MVKCCIGAALTAAAAISLFSLQYPALALLLFALGAPATFPPLAVAMLLAVALLIPLFTAESAIVPFLFF